MNNRIQITLSAGESLLDITERLDASEIGATIELDVGECRALHSSVALRILRGHLAGRTLIIISDDPVLRRLAEHQHITCHKRREITGEHHGAHQAIMRHNFTAWQYFLYESKRIARKISTGIGKYFQFWATFSVSRLPFLILWSGVILAISLLGFIFYFAVARTTIVITPQPSVRSVVANFLYTSDASETISDRVRIPLRKISVPITSSKDFRLATLDPQSVRNAYGQVEFLNELTTEQILRPTTRLSTDDGVIYRTTEWVRIPPAKTLSGVLQFGRAVTTVSADTLDERGNVIGVRGNIDEGVIMTIPGLKFNRDKVYARTLAPLTGGFDPKETILTQEELDRTIAVYQEVLAKEAKNQIGEEIKKISGPDTTWELFSAPKRESIVYQNFTVKLAEGKIGEKRWEIRLIAEGQAYGWAFDRSRVVRILENRLQDSLLIGTERLMSFRESSLRISESVTQGVDTPQALEIKATTEIEALTIYDFASPNNPTARRLAALMAGESFDTAKALLLKEPTISTVEIKSSPFWMTSLASSPAAITFEIKK